jgi:hypothetical protein
MSPARWLLGATSDSAFGAPTVDGENKMQLMHGLDELGAQGRMTWIEARHGWVAAPDDVVEALSKDGFEECKRETTTSRRDLQPAGGVWAGCQPGHRSRGVRHLGESAAAGESPRRRVAPEARVQQPRA